MNPRSLYILLFFALLLSAPIEAQTSKRKRLEARRVQLQKDKVYINALLSNTKRREKNVLVELKDINDKIRTRNDLIKAITSEFN